MIKIKKLSKIVYELDFVLSSPFFPPVFYSGNCNKYFDSDRLMPMPVYPIFLFLYLLLGMSFL